MDRRGTNKDNNKKENQQHQCINMGEPTKQRHFRQRSIDEYSNDIQRTNNIQAFIAIAGDLDQLCVSLVDKNICTNVRKRKKKYSDHS